MTSDKLKLAHMAVCDALGNLADTVFARGMKLTFVMRDPANDECYMVVGDDTPEGTIAAIERSRKAATLIPATDGSGQ